MPNAAPINEWDDWLFDWSAHLHQGRLAAETAKVYLRGARQFVAYLIENYPDAAANPANVRRRDVESWLGYLTREGRSPATRRVRLMGLRVLFAWLKAEPGSDIAEDPTDGVQPPTVPLEPVPIVPNEAVTAMLKTCDDSARFVDLRDAAIIRLLYAAGLRRAELVGTDVEGLDLRACALYVLGKGNKPRIVSISGTKLHLGLSRYLRLRRRHPGAADPALFLSTRVSDSGSWRLTGGAVALILHRRAKQADVEPIHPHQLRHTWAHAAKSARLSDEELERMGGWSRGSGVVRRYGAELADERARQALRDANLGDQV